MEKTILSVTSLFALTTACSIMKPPQTMPDATVPAVVQVMPSQAWTDTGLVVRKGDSLFFSATGEIHWSQRESTVSPDGIKGLPGWTVGPGGLVGRVARTSKIFDIGARTQPFPVKNARVHLSYPPPPIAVPGEGTLLLGFKQFEPGPHSGAFEVTIRRGGENSSWQSPRLVNRQYIRSASCLVPLECLSFSLFL